MRYLKLIDVLALNGDIAINFSSKVSFGMWESDEWPKVREVWKKGKKQTKLQVNIGGRNQTQA